jgi:hypothetical protein
MQVTPEAGRDTAKRFGVAYDWNRLVSDPVYNTQMGAAELAALLKEYRGSYIMAFAGYNAGRGRVEQWVAQHGDPRDPNVDAVDWVERIPFAETRNYVQRVMENLQVYRARFGTSTVAAEPNLHRVARVETSAEPAVASSKEEPTLVQQFISPGSQVTAAPRPTFQGAQGRLNLWPLVPLAISVPLLVLLRLGWLWVSSAHQFRQTVLRWVFPSSLL